MAPILEFYDGFDNQKHENVVLRYPNSQYGGSQGNNSQGYCPDKVDSLYFDRCSAIFNTGFGRAMYRRTVRRGGITPATSLWVGGHWRFAPTFPPWNTASDFLQLDSDNGLGTIHRQIALMITADRRLQVWTGGNVIPLNANGTGTLRYESAPDFFSATYDWEWYDFYFTTAGNFQAWRNGVKVVDENIVTTGGGSGYSYIAFCWEHFGTNVHNLDNYGWSLNERIQPLRVTSVGVHAIFGDRNTGSYTATGNYPPSVVPDPPIGGRLRDYVYTFGNSPDGDLTYVQGSGKALFQMERCIPVGEPIYALQVVATMFGVSAPAVVKGVVETAGIEYESAAQTVSAGPDYKTYTFQWDINPATLEPWRETEFVSGEYTFGWTATSSVRVTQLVVSRAHLLQTGIGSLYRAR